MTTPHHHQRTIPTSYAVIRPARTGNGDAFPCLITERTDLDEARLAALAHLDAYPHVWIECWHDLGYAKERTRSGKRSGEKPRIVERFHRREMATA
jgi:hypothetical protein